MTCQRPHGFFECGQEAGPWALPQPAFCGVPRAHLGDLIEELAGPWLARQKVTTDRLLVTLVRYRTGLPRDALAERYGNARPTVSRAVAEIRPLTAAHGFTAPDRTGTRLRPMADAFAYAETEGVSLRIDGAEPQVRRPQASRPGRRAFVSGKTQQNPIKTTTRACCDGRARAAQGACTTRPRRAPRASPSSSDSGRRRQPRSTAKVDKSHPDPDNKSPDQVSPRRRSEGQRPARRAAHPAGNATTAALQAHLRRAHQRQPAALAPTPALPQSPRELHRDPPGNRLTDLGPLRPPTNPPQAEHRIGARLADGLLINHLPTRQTSTPRPQSQTESSEQTR
ncbi:transposase family protein [Streptomyces sp. WAC 06725]|uniref:helix-turn-helix domain-containing protein n=1 Tax=Streptomyces sp. WAC 06725 TaxID=2203209 RepID=UPI0021AD6DEA|nr:transposase family protein [Streptomyces sp. WAC 06725]